MRTTGTLAAVVFSIVGCAVMATGLTAQVVTGSFPAGELYEAPAPGSPPSESRLFVRSITTQTRESSLALPGSGGGGLILWVVPLDEGSADTTLIETTLTTPSGDRLRAREASSPDQRLRRTRFQGEDLDLPVNASQEVLHVARAEAGIYTLGLQRRNAEDPVTVVVAEPDSPVVMITTAEPLSRGRGEPITLRARLREGSSPITDASVTARVAAPGVAATEPVELFDDGRHGDGIAGDGVFAATIRDLGDEAGLWDVRFEAEGAATEGRPFARTGSAGFVTEPLTARLLGESVDAKVVDTDRGRVLRVEAKALVDVPGQFRLDVIVAGSADAEARRSAVAWGELTQSLTRGTSALSIEIPIAAAESESLHCDIRLVSLDPVGLAGRATVDVAAK